MFSFRRKREPIEKKQIKCRRKGNLIGKEYNIPRKIPKISPEDLYFSKALFEGLIYGGKFAFQNRLGLYLDGNVRLKIDWASLWLKGNLCQQFAEGFY